MPSRYPLVNLWRSVNLRDREFWACGEIRSWYREIALGTFCETESFAGKAAGSQLVAAKAVNKKSTERSLSVLFLLIAVAAEFAAKDKGVAEGTYYE